MAEAAANGDAAGGDRQQAASTAAGSNPADLGSPHAELSDADNVPKAVESDPTQRYTRVRTSSAAGAPDDDNCAGGSCERARASQSDAGDTSC
jgi:hypothetical protein